MANHTRPTHARLRYWIVGGPRAKVRHLVDPIGTDSPLCGMSLPRGTTRVSLPASGVDDPLLLAATKANLPVCDRCQARAAATAEALFGVSVRRWRSRVADVDDRLRSSRAAIAIARTAR